MRFVNTWSSDLMPQKLHVAHASVPKHRREIQDCANAMIGSWHNVLNVPVPCSYLSSYCVARSLKFLKVSLEESLRSRGY